MNTDPSPRSGESPTYAELAAMWSARDPAPVGLADRALVAIEMDDLDAEYEVLHLIEHSRTLTGTRAVAAADADPSAETLTIVFSGNSCSLMMRVSPLDSRHRRIDGWVSPPHAADIQLKQQDREVTAESDARGRFEVDRMPSGLTRAVLTCAQADADGEHLFATPAFEL